MTHPGGLVGGRYRLAERIGAGAMGVVWRAHDERLNRTVALKQLVLPATLTPAQAHEAAERVMREGRIAARLHHPNAISVFDVTDHDASPWLVMEYLMSRSLAAVLAERGPRPPREVAAIGRQLAEALAAAHAAGITHRDIKPGNVLLGDGPASGIAKLTDFGISRATDDVTVTRTGVLSGTPAYLAPEVARGADPTTAADVFALGATLYATVEGQPPFGVDTNALAVLHRVARGKVRPPRQAGPLTALLMHLLRAEPAERPTMAQAAVALARIAAGEPPTGPRAVPTAPPAFWAGPAGTGGGTLPAGKSRPGGAAPDGHTRMDLPRPLLDEPPEESEGAERRPALLVAVGVALAVLAGLFALAAGLGDDEPTARAPAATSAPPATTPPPPTTTTTVTTTTTTVRQASAAELQRAVTEYYALLPRRPEQAWDRLAPALQAGGFAAYEKAWDDVESVQALPTSSDPAAMTVRVFVVYRKDDRRPTAEVRELTLAYTGDALLIERDTRVGGAAPPTTTRKRGRG